METKFGIMVVEITEEEVLFKVRLIGSVSARIKLDEIATIYVTEPRGVSLGGVVLAKEGVSYSDISFGYATSIPMNEGEFNKGLEVVDELQRRLPDVKVVGYNAGVLKEERKEEKRILKEESEKNKRQIEIAKNEIKCEMCGSTNATFMENNRKNFSAGKALLGSMLIPGGALAGFMGKKGKDRWKCNECGNVFETEAK